MIYAWRIVLDRYCAITQHRGYVIETGQIVLVGDTSHLVENEHVKRAYLGA